METGSRDLDAAVAERVMGWRRVEKETAYFWPSDEMITTRRAAHPNCLAIDYFAAPQFSTNIEDAWRVVDRLYYRYGARIELHQRPWDYHWSYAQEPTRTFPAQFRWDVFLTYESLCRPPSRPFDGSEWQFPRLHFQRTGNDLPWLICFVALEFVDAYGGEINEYHRRTVAEWP